MISARRVRFRRGIGGTLASWFTPDREGTLLALIALGSLVVLLVRHVRTAPGSAASGRDPARGRIYLRQLAVLDRPALRQSALDVVCARAQLDRGHSGDDMPKKVRAAQTRSGVEPEKSWEGSVASVVSSVIFGVAYIPQVIGAVALWEVAGIAAVANVAGQIGDLSESALKRGAGMKDSGTLLPGPRRLAGPRRFQPVRRPRHLRVVAATRARALER